MPIDGALGAFPPLAHMEEYYAARKRRTVSTHSSAAITGL